MNKILTVIFTVLVFGVNAQTSLDTYLESVIANNKTLKANGLYADWQKEQARTGNTPDNPEIGFGYFPGNSDAIGTKKIFEVSQSFNFPTTYVHKAKLAKQSASIADANNRLQSQHILTQAWENLVMAIYLNKKGLILEKREQEARKMHSNYLKKQKSGDATQLEVNKAKLFLIDLQNKLRLHKGLVAQNNEVLKQLNGGLDYSVTDTTFTKVEIESWDSLFEKIKTLHPKINLTQQSKQFAEQELKISKSDWMPSFNIGYESENIMGAVYRGVRGGVSIPLWKEKNTISAGKINIDYNNHLAEDVILKITLDYKKKYISTTILQGNLQEFNQSLTEMNNNYLLARSLELGQISAIEYFLELNYFYEISDELLGLELEFQIQLAGLYGFTL